MIACSLDKLTSKYSNENQTLSILLETYRSEKTELEEKLKSESSSNAYNTDNLELLKNLINSTKISNIEKSFKTLIQTNSLSKEACTVISNKAAKISTSEEIEIYTKNILTPYLNYFSAENLHEIKSYFLNYTYYFSMIEHKRLISMIDERIINLLPRSQN